MRTHTRAPRPAAGLVLDEHPLFAELIDATRIAARELRLQVVDVRGPQGASDIDRVTSAGALA